MRWTSTSRRRRNAQLIFYLTLSKWELNSDEGGWLSSCRKLFPILMRRDGPICINRCAESVRTIYIRASPRARSPFSAVSFLFIFYTGAIRLMDDLDALLPFFVRELGLLRRGMRPFEHRFPAAASRISLSAGQADDPNTERTIQSAAWINARISQRIDDHDTEFSEAMIETVFPAYLAGVPSCAVAQFDVARVFQERTEAFSIPCGTRLEHRPSLCDFTTAYDVTLAPLVIARAQFSLPSTAPALGGTRLPDETVGILSIEFASRAGDLVAGSALMPQTLRLFLHTDRFLAAALTDAMLLCPQTAFVESDGRRHWQALDLPPVSPVGFARTDALLKGDGKDPHSAFRLLMEYAAFPHKFRFVDIDFAAMLRRGGSGRRITLHLPVSSEAASQSARERLGQLRAEHLRLFCVPIVNRFDLGAMPAEIRAGVSIYPITLPEREAAPAVIHSIDSVQMMRGDLGGAQGSEIPPHRSFRHWSSVGVFWLRERDRWEARQATGSDDAIKFVDLDERPTVPKATKLAIALTCTNGDLSDQLSIGGQGGDLYSETLNFDGPISMLIAATAPMQPARDNRALSRLVAAMSPSTAALSAPSLGELRALLDQFDTSPSRGSTQYVSGIVGVHCAPIKRMMQIEPIPMPILVPGVLVTLSIDEEAFAGHSLHTFSLLMERYFLRYAGQDCIELVVRARRGVDIYKGEPILGAPGLSSV